MTDISPPPKGDPPSRSDRVYTNSEMNLATITVLQLLLRDLAASKRIDGDRLAQILRNGEIGSPESGLRALIEMFASAAQDGADVHRKLTGQ